MEKRILYIDHLYQCIQIQKENAIQQRGKTDLEQPNSLERICVWYDHIVEIVKSIPPLDYVETLNIFENELHEIVDVQYIYFSGEQRSIPNTTINIFRQ